MPDQVEMVQRPKCHCLRCKYTWVARTEDLPVQCPKCGSARWNRPRTQRKAKKDQ